MSSKKKSLCSLNRQLKTRRIFHQAQEDPIECLCYHWHTTTQHSIDENYNVFYENYGWKVNWKTVTSMSKKMTYEKKKIAFISCQINTEEKIDICLRLPWLAVEALIMEKRIWTQQASELAKSDPRPLPHLRGVEFHILTKLWKWTMTICEKFCNGKLPDKQSLNKKEVEPSESSRVDWMA